MSDNTPKAATLDDLTRNIPHDLRCEWPIQWHEDGTPSGHSMAPVGKYVHEQRARIADLEAENSQLRTAAIRKDCNWVYEEDTDMYETGCGRAFCFIHGDPEENFFLFCYHCGGNLVLAALEPNHD